jgi:hypothetical protein
MVPIYGILLTFVIQIALNSIYFGTVTGFNTVVSIATEGFCKTSPSFPYSHLLTSNLYRRLLRHPNPSSRPPPTHIHHSQPLRSLESRTLESTNQYNGIGILTLHIHHFQLPYIKFSGFGEYELYFCGCRDGYACCVDYLVHDGERKF